MSTEYKGIENMTQEEIGLFLMTDYKEKSQAWEDWYGCITFGTHEYIEIKTREIKQCPIKNGFSQIVDS